MLHSETKERVLNSFSSLSSLLTKKTHCPELKNSFTNLSS